MKRFEKNQKPPCGGIWRKAIYEARLTPKSKT